MKRKFEKGTGIRRIFHDRLSHPVVRRNVLEIFSRQQVTVYLRNLTRLNDKNLELFASWYKTKYDDERSIDCLKLWLMEKSDQ